MYLLLMHFFLVAMKSTSSLQIVTSILESAGTLRGIILKCIAWDISSTFFLGRGVFFLTIFIRFVSAIHIPRSDPASLISGGGDPMLKIWDWMTGVLKHEVEVLDAVEPFMAVRALKKKRGYGDLDDEGEIPEGARIKRKKGNRKGKGKEKAKEQDDDADEGEREDEDKEEDSKPEKVLVVKKIDTLSSDSGPQVVFSAVGYVS
jgi:hypothetical protein